MTRKQVITVIILVVAILIRLGSLPVASSTSPPPPAPSATSVPAFIEPTSEQTEDVPQNIPINAHLAVGGDLWITPTPGPAPSDMAFLYDLGISSERYGDLSNSYTIPPEVWQAWPCGAKPGWPQSHAQWCPLVTYFSQKIHNGFVDINPDVLLGYMRFECPTGQPDCQNPGSAATGLCQVMPGDDPRSLKYKNKAGVSYFTGRPSVSQLNDPVFNIAFCTRLVGGYIVAEGGSEMDGFRRLGHQYEDDIWKEVRTIRNYVLQYAGYDPYP